MGYCHVFILMFFRTNSVVPNTSRIHEFVDNVLIPLIFSYFCSACAVLSFIFKFAWNERSVNALSIEYKNFTLLMMSKIVGIGLHLYCSRCPHNTVSIAFCCVCKNLERSQEIPSKGSINDFEFSHCSPIHGFSDVGEKSFHFEKNKETVFMLGPSNWPKFKFNILYRKLSSHSQAKPHRKLWKLSKTFLIH